MVQHAGLSGPSGMCDNHHAGMFQACKSSHAVCHESTCEAPGFAGPFQRFLSTRAQPAQSMICCRQPVESQTPGATPPSAAWSRAPLMPSPRSKVGDSRRSMACPAGGLAEGGGDDDENAVQTCLKGVHQACCPLCCGVIKSCQRSYSALETAYTLFRGMRDVRAHQNLW